MLNNSKDEIHQGDSVEWCFFDDSAVVQKPIRTNVGQPTIVMRRARSDERIFGRAMSNAVPGQLIAVLILN